ncbi:MAG: tyrosine-type recombinase/integrase [Actinobacteria bacterium]|nr:tyrosine-type recombinase/integrase [Actinomycetota bacterium]
MAGNLDWELARQDYLLAKQLQGVSPRTLSDYDGGTGQFVGYLEKNNLNLTTASIRQFLAGLDVGPVTLGIRIKVLRTFCRWLHSEGYLKTDVMVPIPNPKTPTVFPHVLPEDDIRKLIQVAKKRPRDLAIVLVLLDTGIRASECCSLTLDDVDLDGRSLLVRNGKGQKERYVFFSDTTARAISRWLAYRPADACDDALFISQKTREGMTRNCLCVAIKRLGARAGIKGTRCSPHSCRHTFATQWIKAGGDTHSLQKMLGHTTTRMAEKYVHLVGADVSELHRRYSPVGRLRLVA